VTALLERGLLATPTARLFFIATFLGPLSEGMFGLTLLIWVARSGGSTLALGVLLGLTMVPSLIAGPLAGVWIDRLNQAGLATAMTLLRFLTVVALLLLPAHTGPPSTAFYGLIAFYYLFWYLGVPNTDSLLRRILSADQYVVGSSAAQGAYQAGVILSTIVAGAIVTVWGTNAAFATVALIVLGTGGCFALLARRTGVAAEPQPRDGYGAELAAGFRYILSDRRIVVYGLVTALVLPTYQVMNVLIAPQVFDTLRGSSFDLGLVDSAAGIGAIISAAACAVVAKRMTSVPLVLAVSILALAACLLGFARASSVALGFAAYLLVGIFIGNMRVLVRALLYERVAPEFIGRTMSAISTLGLTVAIAFALGAGLLARTSLLPAYEALAGVLALVAVVLMVPGSTGRAENV
jgi:predicted MFS family arabinose efflux permease